MNANEERASSTGADIQMTDAFVGIVGLNVLEVGDELVVLDPLSGKSFRINASGAAIWRLVARGASLAELCEGLEELYSMEPAKAEAVAREFLEALDGRGLVTRVRQPS